MLLLQNRHVLLERNVAKRYVRLTRTAVRFDTVAQAVATFTSINAVLDLVGRGSHGFLVDSRLAPLRNDATFEAAIRGPRSRTARGFARAAVLLATAIGASQMTRVVREDQVDMLVTCDEAVALAHVCFPASHSSTPIAAR